MTHSDSELPYMQQVLLDAAERTRMTSSQIEEQLKREIRTDWNLSPEAQKLCDTYFLLHWSGDAFRRTYYSSRGEFVRYGKTFKIKWNCSMKVQKETLKAERIGMSFRRMIGNETGIVIPKIIHGMAAPAQRAP